MTRFRDTPRPPGPAPAPSPSPAPSGPSPRDTARDQARTPPPRPPVDLFAWGRPLPARWTPFAHPARQVRSRHSRERLIAAVECVIRELGPSGATVRSIAQRAGVSVGTVYRRFPNKAALMDAVGQRYVRTREERIRAVLSLGFNRAGTRLYRGRSLVRGLVASAEHDREMTRAFGRVPCPADEMPAAVTALLARRVRRRGLAGELLTLLVRAVLSGPGGSAFRPSREPRSSSTSPSPRTW